MSPTPRELREHRRALQSRIEAVEAEMATLRRGGSPSRDEVERLAERLGRKRQRGYGNEPTYRNEWFPDLRTLTIPGHSQLKRGTALKILDQLEGDLDAMRHQLDRLGGPLDGE